MVGRVAVSSPAGRGCPRGSRKESFLAVFLLLNFFLFVAKFLKRIIHTHQLYFYSLIFVKKSVVFSTFTVITVYIFFNMSQVIISVFSLEQFSTPFWNDNCFIFLFTLFAIVSITSSFFPKHFSGTVKFLSSTVNPSGYPSNPF